MTTELTRDGFSFEKTAKLKYGSLSSVCVCGGGGGGVFLPVLLP